jgi:hypothetical protein
MILRGPDHLAGRNGAEECLSSPPLGGKGKHTHDADNFLNRSTHSLIFLNQSSGLPIYVFLMDDELRIFKIKTDFTIS